MSEEMNFTTGPCEWTDKDDDIVADYLLFKELGLKNSSSLSD